jgi:thiol:disulfide interchange protein
VLPLDIFKKLIENIIHNPMINLVVMKNRVINIVGGALVVLVIVAGLVFNFTKVGSGQQIEAAEFISDNYYTYAPDAYQQSRAEGDVVVLNFYADWCATCNAFEPTLKSVMGQMSVDADNGSITAFRVNFGDNKQSQSGKQLAKDFGITTQTTTVILTPDGNVFKTYFTPVSEGELRQSLITASLVN